MHFFQKYFPLIASAYSAAIFIFFTFLSNTKFDAFTYTNLVLMSFWAAYCWIVIYNQDNIINRLTITMENVSASLTAALAELNDEEIKEDEKKV